MTQAADEILLTIHLKHQKDKNLEEINAKLDAAGFWPATKLRDVNLAIEQCAWGAFDTEFYPTYDFQLVWQKIRQEKGG